MGAGQSVEVPGGGSEGYHILRVQENSPAHKAGMEPFFDFIVMIENVRLDTDDERLKELLKANVEKPISVVVYSSKTLQTRELNLTPSSLWGGQGLLGVSIKFGTFEGANEHVWHVLDVEPNSPAYIAGLRPFSDYIIGSDSLLSEQDDLFSLIESHEGRQVKLFVYNSDVDTSREVVLTPNSVWGGEGSLGCGIGYGYLHRIPTSFTEQKSMDVSHQHHLPPAGGVPTPVAATLSKDDQVQDAALAHPTSSEPKATSQANLPGNLVTTSDGKNETNVASPLVLPTADDSLPSVNSEIESIIPGLPPMVNLNMPSSLSTMAPLNIPDISALPALSNLPPINLPSGLTIPAVTGIQLPSVDSLVASMPSLNISEPPKVDDLNVSTEPSDVDSSLIQSEKTEESSPGPDVESQQVENNLPETNSS